MTDKTMQKTTCAKLSNTVCLYTIYSASFKLGYDQCDNYVTSSVDEVKTAGRGRAVFFLVFLPGFSNTPVIDCFS